MNRNIYNKIKGLSAIIAKAMKSARALEFAAHRITAISAMLLFCLFCPIIQSSQAAEIADPAGITIKTRQWENFKLIGTICQHNAKLNLAIIEDGQNKQAVYRINSNLPSGEKIQSIFPDHILLEKDSQKKVLKITKGSNTNLDEPANIAAKGCQKISDQEWIIDPAEIVNSISDIAKLSQVKITAQTNGLKIERLSDFPFLKNIGLQEGDIIRQINGQQFTGLYEALNYLWGLDDADLQIQITRNNQSQTLKYYPVYNPVPSPTYADSLTPQTVASLLTARHEYQRVNVVYK